MSSIPSRRSTTFSPTRLNLSREGSRPYLGWQSLSMTPTSLLCWRYATFAIRFILPVDSRTKCPLGLWQAKCWDPEFGSTMFDDFCSSLSRPFGKRMAESLGLPYEHANGTVQLTDELAVDAAIVKYGSWIKKVSFSVFVLILIKSSIRTSFQNALEVVLLKM